MTSASNHWKSNLERIRRRPNNGLRSQHWKSVKISDDERIARLEIEPRAHQKTARQRTEIPNNPGTTNDPPMIQAP
jgi:hypothetical protein